MAAGYSRALAVSRTDPRYIQSPKQIPFDGIWRALFSTRQSLLSLSSYVFRLHPFPILLYTYHTSPSSALTGPQHSLYRHVKGIALRCAGNYTKQAGGLVLEHGGRHPLR